MKSKLAVFIALDVETREQALSLVEQTHSLVLGYKLGPRLFLKHKDLIDCIKKYDSSLQVFLDFKFYDIPSSTIEAVKTTYDLGADLVTIHASVGAKTLEQLSEISWSRPFKILPVTVLSSVEQDAKTLETVQNLTDMVVKSGLKALVCSPLELPFLRKRYPSLYLVTPGIRFEKDNCDDQKRVMTPQKALQLGSSALVMGRSLTQAKNPLKLLEDLKDSL